MVDHDENDVENKDDLKAAAVSSKKANMKTRPGLKKRRKK
jgi:hypothetical protein